MLCLFCGAGEAEVRYDKRNRPWLTCGACAVRVFPRGALAIAVYASASEFVHDHLGAMALRELGALRLLHAQEVTLGSYGRGATPAGAGVGAAGVAEAIRAADRQPAAAPDRS